MIGAAVRVMGPWVAAIRRGTMPRTGPTVLAALVLTGCGLPHDGAVTVVDVAPPPVPTHAPGTARAPGEPDSGSPTGPATGSATTHDGPTGLPPARPQGPAPFFVTAKGCLAADHPPVFASTDTVDQAEALLVALAAGPGQDGHTQGWVTRVSASQRLSVGDAANGTLQLVVPTEGDGRPRDAWWTAQIVHTAVSLPGVSTVRFVTPDGELVRVPVMAAGHDAAEVRAGMVAPACR